MSWITCKKFSFNTGTSFSGIPLLAQTAVYVVSGAGELKLSRKTVFGPGDFYFFPPQTSFCFTPAEACVFIRLEVQLQRSPMDIFGHFRDRTDQPLLGILKFIEYEAGAQMPGWQDTVHELLRVMRSCLMRLNRRTTRSASDAAAFQRRLIENASNPDFDIEAELDAAGFSRDHFRRLFQKRTGMSPQRYFTHLRMEHAGELLRATSLSTGVIARCVGFDDPHYFSRVFKKVMGITARACRKQARR